LPPSCSESRARTEFRSTGGVDIFALSRSIVTARRSSVAGFSR
jgi:hypothetical protein